MPIARWRCAREGCCWSRPSPVSSTRRKRIGRWRPTGPCRFWPASTSWTRTGPRSSATDDIEKTLKAKPIALQLPIGLGESFSGVIDLITMRAHAYTRKPDGRFGGFVLEDVPEQLQAEAKRLRTRLVEAVAETDDAMLEAYLDGR